MSLNDVLRGLDRGQQRHRRVSFLAAVAKKFSDDQAGQLAALIAYYGFVSLFPLLLALVTVLGFVLQGDPDLQQKILNGTLGQFPILSDQLKLHSLSGSGLALAIGIIGALLAGLGITSATQNAFNRIWDVPFKHRPDFLHARLRERYVPIHGGSLPRSWTDRLERSQQQRTRPEGPPSSSTSYGTTSALA